MVSRNTSVQFGIVLAIVGAVAIRCVAAQSDVIAIGSGTFTFDGIQGSGSITLSGNRGFRLDAATGDGVFVLYTKCQTPDCTPGTVVSLEARWLGNDLGGSAQLRGQSYDDMGSLDGDSSADVGFSGSVTMPPLANQSVSVVVPFDFAGGFAYGLTGPSPQQALLTGGGRVTITLRPRSDAPAWQLERAVFEFQRTSD